MVELKEYHRRQESLPPSNNSSQERKKFNLRFKLRENSSSAIMKTEGNESS
jgi:hypothetical protein